MLPSESTGPMMPNAENFGWLCVPLVADTCVAWGNEAIEAFSQLASRLATLTCMPKSFPKFTAAGPSGLRIQHLIDAAEAYIPLQIPLQSLKAVINLLTSGNAPKEWRLDLYYPSLSKLLSSPPFVHLSLDLNQFTTCLIQAIEVFNNMVSLGEAIAAETVLFSPPTQKKLSSKLDDYLFNHLLNLSTLADKVCLLSISSPHAPAWMSLTPSESFGLHLDPPVFQVAIKWWLFRGTLCPGNALDHLGHHASPTSNNPTVTTASLAQLTGSLAKTAALDVSNTSLLNPLSLLEARVLAKTVTEARKHQANDPKCSELGWTQASSSHLASFEQCFLCSVVRAAAPVVTLASKMIVGLSEDVTDRSKAAGLPRTQLEPKGNSMMAKWVQGNLKAQSRPSHTL
eukprot:Em0013g731a